MTGTSPVMTGVGAICGAASLTRPVAGSATPPYRGGAQALRRIAH